MSTHAVLEAYGRTMNLAAVLYPKGVRGDYRGKNNRWGSPIPSAIRFWSKVAFGEKCWEWQASQHAYGYGQFGTMPAHTYLAKWLGYVTNRNNVIDHECNNPRCVRPTHLRLVPTRVNVLRGKSYPAQMAAKTHCKRGHALSGDNLRIDQHRRGDKVFKGRSCRACEAIRWQQARNQQLSEQTSAAAASDSEASGKEEK